MTRPTRETTPDRAPLPPHLVSMKPVQPNTSGGRGVKTSNQSVNYCRQDDSPYLSARETDALLKTSRPFKIARLAADDMVSTDGAAALAGTSRVTINAWIKHGRCIGLTRTTRGYRLPAWQFEPAIWDTLPELSRALGTTDGWRLLTFLETPSGALGGIAPRAALEQGLGERVLAIAVHEGN